MRTIVRGACPLDCPDTCSWLVEVEDGRAVGLRGDRAHPFTHGALCPKVNRYLDALHGPGRLTHPLRRVGAKGEGRFEEIGWDEAIEASAAGLRSAIERHGAESVLPYYFAGTEGMVQGWILGPRLFAALGASRLQTTICTAAANAALNATYGGSVGMDPEDVEYAQLVILWGANLLSTNLHQWRFVLAAQRRGAHVVAIDPLRTDTAERCNEHLAPRPGTDAALALGLMRVVLDEGAEDREWLARCTEGWRELEARLAEWPVERAARDLRPSGRERGRARAPVRAHPADRHPRRSRAAAARRRRCGDARDPRPARAHGRLPARRRRRAVHDGRPLRRHQHRAAWRCPPTCPSRRRAPSTCRGWARP